MKGLNGNSSGTAIELKEMKEEKQKCIIVQRRQTLTKFAAIKKLQWRISNNYLQQF